MPELEKEKLKILLKHWIEHNEEHAEEFREWAEKIYNFEKFGISMDIAHDSLLEAARHMKESVESLGVALAALERGKK